MVRCHTILFNISTKQGSQSWKTQMGLLILEAPYLISNERPNYFNQLAETPINRRIPLNWNPSGSIMTDKRDVRDPPPSLKGFSSWSPRLSCPLVRFHEARKALTMVHPPLVGPRLRHLQSHTCLTINSRNTLPSMIPQKLSLTCPKDLANSIPTPSRKAPRTVRAEAFKKSAIAIRAQHPPWTSASPTTSWPHSSPGPQNCLWLRH